MLKPTFNQENMHPKKKEKKKPLGSNVFLFFLHFALKSAAQLLTPNSQAQTCGLLLVSGCEIEAKSTTTFNTTQ